MTLTSLEFAGFFLASLIVYYIVPSRLQWAVLLLSSVIFFLLSAEPYTIIYLLASAVITAGCARSIEKRTASGEKKTAKKYLLVGVLVNVAMLATLKYNGFVINNANKILALMHISVQIPHPQLATPIGISFYTLTALAYLLDSYWGIITPEKNLGKGALLVGYWPSLTSGPISRYAEMGGLYEKHRFSYDSVTFGLQRMLWGVFKKLVISARLGIIVDTIYADTMLYNGLYIWLAAALFMFQLYTDFSGCMDIVIGASECFGITLPENFRTPFFSCSVQEYWQRWHITLGGWLRDYIMYPVMRSGAWKRMTRRLRKSRGKKLFKKLPSYLAMLIVWLLMGLWHGGSWKYIFGMGVYFWALIMLSQVLEPIFKKMTALLKVNTECFSWRLFQSLRVFGLVMIGNMFFRLDGFITTLRVIREGMHWNPWIFFDGSLFKLGLDRADFFVMLFSLGILLLVSALQEKGRSVRQRLAEQNLAFRWIILLALIFGIIIFGMYGLGYNAADFIYGQF